MPRRPWRWFFGAAGRGSRAPPPLCKPWSLTMSGVVAPIRPVFQKPTEPDPRLARLAKRIEQIRHARALRFRRPAERSKDLH